MNTYIGLLIPVGIIALILLLAYVKAMRSRVPWWAASVKKRNAYPSKGSVYACHCREIPGIAKVGMTQRDTITKRMGEIQRKMTGHRVRLYFAIDDMPFAWAVEQEAHRILRARNIRFPKGDTMGTEWFSCLNDGELQAIVDAMTNAAFAVRYYAVSVGAWPEWAKPMLIEMRFGKPTRKPLFTAQNSPGLKIAG